MNNLKYTAIIIAEIFKLLIRRLFGIKKYPSWDLKTELVWTSTRATLLSSNRLGLPWLKKLSSQFKPKSSLKDTLSINELEYKTGRCLSVKPKESATASKKVIIYFHGGGYVTGSPDTIIEFTGRLATQSQAELIVPYYPTAPEQQYPAAHLFAHQFVVETLEAFGEAEVYLAGDSAGAALVLSTISNLSASQNAQLKACILISPWVEPLTETGSIQSNEPNDVGDHTFLLACYHAYLGEQTLLKDYPLSFALSNLPKLPPTLLTIGSAELLVDQTKRLQENLQHLQTETELFTYETMFHTFWNLAPSIKEADEIIGDISRWIEKS
ncbi:MAG: alpha/beta hydrolase [Bacteroidia bacterium]